MKRCTLFTLALCFLFTHIVDASTLWIVGENYVGRMSDRGTPYYWYGINPDSWAMDHQKCRLWVRDEMTTQLMSFDVFGESSYHDTVDAVLSDIHQGYFLTRSTQIQALEKRSDGGKLLESVELPSTSFVQQIVATKNRLWSLNFDKSEYKVWLTEMTFDFKLVSNLPINASFVIWPNFRLMLHPLSQHLWLGFSTRSTDYSYVPVMEERQTDGVLVNEWAGTQRGLFFDFCADGNNVLMAHDLPSNSGFTVPVFSFLERVTQDGKTETYYTAYDNHFIDSLVCRTNDILMIQRSIFGSEGSFLVRWQRKKKDFGEKLFKLPARGLKLYECLGE